jgi:RNA polymerase sigma-70 factor (ECF subfamily)
VTRSRSCSTNHYDRIHGLAWQLTGSRTDADDIAQDVCCTWSRKIGSYRGEAKFTTWLHGITFNACRDWRRRRRSFGAFSEKLAVLVGLGRTARRRRPMTPSGSRARSAG